MRQWIVLGISSLSTILAVLVFKNPANTLDLFQMPNLPSPPKDGRVFSHSGLVVSTQAQASRVGTKILQQGGNAVDAAVAIGYALAVTEPCCGNLGGGGFMLIQPKNGPAVFLDFRETAPLQSNSALYLQRPAGSSRNGYLAVGTPGTVLGLDTALQKYGTMTRAQVMAPAIELAQKGFILTQGDVDILHAGQEKIKRSSLSKIFLKKDGSAYQVGDLLIQKELATTLRKISQAGVRAFYQGEIAQDIVNASKREGGILTLEDFSQYKIKQERPLTCSYRGYEILTAPPPGGGLPLCQMLNILEGYPLRETGYKSPQSLHWFFSAMFYGFRDRNTYLGDPDFVKIPQAQLLSKQYAAKLRQSIPNYFAFDHLTTAAPIKGNTTHYSVVDRQGNAVAVTYTLNSYFGAGVMAENTGFILNNEMDDFTTNLGQSNQFGLKQGTNNLVEPNKRPLSSMAPTIVRINGQLFLVTGSPGGSTIITTVLQILTNIIDYNMRVDQAVYAPRFHYQGEPSYVLTEKNGLSADLQSGLEARGYRFSNRLANWGAAETILRTPQGILEGVNDYRRPAGAALTDSKNN